VTRFGIQSIEVGARLLEALTAAGRPLPLGELARRAHMHPGKAHRYLVSYVRTGIVAQDRNNGHYGIGPAAIALGLAGLRSADVVRVASDLLPDLRDATDETALLALWGSGGPVVVRLEESARPVFMNIRVGSVLPVLRTATGRVFAAFLPPEETRRLIAAERRALAGRGAYGAGPIGRLLAATRRRGVARVAGDLVPGVAALAAPVFDHKGRIAAVVGTLGRVEEMATSFTGPVARAVTRCADEISRRLGHAPGPSAR
jgi:DNA-binding IclR family transcriptional regulator